MEAQPGRARTEAATAAANIVFICTPLLLNCRRWGWPMLGWPVQTTLGSGACAGCRSDQHWRVGAGRDHPAGNGLARSFISFRRCAAPRRRGALHPPCPPAFAAPTRREWPPPLPAGGARHTGAGQEIPPHPTLYVVLNARVL